METNNNNDRPELIIVSSEPTPAPAEMLPVTEVKVSSTMVALPHTGVDTGVVAGIGLMLVLVGTALVRRFA